MTWRRRRKHRRRKRKEEKGRGKKDKNENKNIMKNAVQLFKASILQKKHSSACTHTHMHGYTHMHRHTLTCTDTHTHTHTPHLPGKTQKTTQNYKFTGRSSKYQTPYNLSAREVENHMLKATVSIKQFAKEYESVTCDKNVCNL